MVTKNAINSGIPIEASLGGTNATSFSTNTGIVKYDGTRLVTSTTATIDASNRMKNTAQPAFAAFLANTATNKTGTGGYYTLGTDALTEVFDQGGDFNVNGTFTAPVTGRYLLSGQGYITGCTVAAGSGAKIITTNRTYWPAIMPRPASANDIASRLAVLADMTAGDTAQFQIASSGEASATGDVAGSATGQYNFFKGFWFVDRINGE